MNKIRVFGGTKLNGQINVCCAKNALLPILAGAILSNKEIILNSVPKYSDIEKMCTILQNVGFTVKWEDEHLILNGENANNSYLPQELTKDIRSGIVCLGALLSRFKKAKMSYPGGCNIGSRPIDLHISGLKALGAEITEEHGYIIADGKNMKAGNFELHFPSVGATENLMLACVMLNGTSVISNVAREPEIVDLANFLNSMGCKIKGAGTCTLEITGVTELKSTSYTAIPDRIIAGTYLIGTILAGGDVEICKVNPLHLKSVINKYLECACKIDVKNDKIRVLAKARPKSIKEIVTMPYPLFPTDLQSIIMAQQCYASGRCLIKENLFEGRFRQVPELIKMGADITISGTNAFVTGKKHLSGADVTATDLRAGASLVLAGLKADGYTTISDCYHIERGYVNLPEELNSLGANIKIIEE